ncbi:MAG: nuclear transport factor 2 family protein [Sneathiella sp.]
MPIDDLVDAYCACWADMDSEQRLVRLTTVFAENGFYHDPTVQISGLKAFEKHIASVVTQRPGSIIERTTGIDLHHNTARFGWNLKLADGKKLPEGIDIIWLDESEEKITGILGFFGPLKPIER